MMAAILDQHEAPEIAATNAESNPTATKPGSREC